MELNIIGEFCRQRYLRMNLPLPLPLLLQSFSLPEGNAGAQAFTLLLFLSDLFILQLVDMVHLPRSHAVICLVFSPQL